MTKGTFSNDNNKTKDYAYEKMNLHFIVQFRRCLDLFSASFSLRTCSSLRCNASIQFQMTIQRASTKIWTGSTQISHLGSNEKRFFKPELFNVCANFTKVSLEIRARVISQGLVIFLRRSEVSDPSWSCSTFVPALIQNCFGEDG